MLLVYINFCSHGRQFQALFSYLSVLSVLSGSFYLFKWSICDAMMDSILS